MPAAPARGSVNATSDVFDPAPIANTMYCRPLCRNVIGTAVVFAGRNAALPTPSHRFAPSIHASIQPAGVHDAGRATCRDALTGKLHWNERLGKHHSASPVCAEGRLYFVDDDGNTFVVKADKKFELIEKNPIGEDCYASPAFSKGQIFLRGSKHLWCIADKHNR